MTTTTDANETLAFLRDARPLHRRAARWSSQSLQLGLRLAELTVVFLVGIVAASCMPPAFGSVAPLWTLLAACGATIAAVEVGRLRRSIRPRLSALSLQVLAASTAGTVILMLAGLPWRTDLGWGGVELCGAALLLAIIHVVYTERVEVLLGEGRLATHVAVLGTGAAARRLQAQLESADPLAVKVVGCYALEDGPAHLDGVRGTLRTLLSDCRLEFVDAIVLAPDAADAATMGALQSVLRACTQDVYLVPELATASSVTTADVPKVALGPAELLLLSRRPISSGGAFAKRAFDIAGSLALLAFMAPLLGLLALAIKLDSRGPILFQQLRVGYNNQLFYILKFRSMRSEATDRLAKQQTVAGDKRITRVGRIIRRLSLDELPQLLNVLGGEMSLVGPRPHAPGTSIGGQRVHTIVDDYARRHLVPPGITGLAQVRGLRGGLQDRRQVADRLAADLEYIERWSLWLDIRILLGTVVLEMRNSRGS